MTRIAIAFQGGSYGNYLKWALYHLLYEAGDIVVPWRKSTSHGVSYIKHDCVSKYNIELDKVPLYELFTIHPCQGPNDDFLNSLRLINEATDKTLVLYPSRSSYLLSINNYFYKIWDTDKHPLSYIDTDNLVSGWGESSYHNAPRYIQREFLSINLFDMWNSQINWYAPNYCADVHYIFLDELFNNFQQVLDLIRNYLDLDWIRDPADLQEFHEDNKSRQTYLNQDALANGIINSVTNEIPFSWNSDELSLVTEAYIQKSLREQGIMLKCTDLNNFPTSTEELIEVLE